MDTEQASRRQYFRNILPISDASFYYDSPKSKYDDPQYYDLKYLPCWRNATLPSMTYIDIKRSVINPSSALLGQLMQYTPLLSSDKQYFDVLSDTSTVPTSRMELLSQMTTTQTKPTIAPSPMAYELIRRN